MNMYATGQRQGTVIIIGQIWRKNREKGVRRIYKGLNKNGEGYSDYVAARAIQAADKQPEKVSQYIRCIKDLADLFDFEIAGYVSVMDKKTGRVW